MGQRAYLCLIFLAMLSNSITKHMIEIKLNECVDLKKRLFQKLDNLEAGAALFFKGYSLATLKLYCLEWAREQPERLKFSLLEVSNGVCIKKIKKNETKRYTKHGVHS